MSSSEAPLSAVAITARAPESVTEYRTSSGVSIEFVE